VVAHSGPAAERAHDLLGQRDDVVIVRAGGGVAGVRRALRAVASRRWAVVYLVDVGVSTSVASVVARASGSVVVLDTGDVAFELARSKGVVGPVRLAAIWAGERVALAAADEVVVRGRAHAELVPARKRVHHIPDIPPAEARPADADGIRGRLGIDGLFVVGLVGSINWAPRLGRTYGWDVIGALPHLSDRYCALIVGDGDGLARLERRAADLGVADRCRFVGRVAREEVYEYIAAMDVAVSTQTNDVVGAVRTTGKLPLYLACGRPVLASHVGEAASLLGPLGWTLPYDGTTDDAYPERLAGAVADWASDPEQQRRRAEQATILAHEAFDREEWAGRCDQVVGGPGGAPPATAGCPPFSLLGPG
jgi:glycosyltransferase involved in cell wall biosynthesis